jgi:protein TonB
VREYKRRGSFLLFTAAIYAVLFVVSGVAAIYAYDARLEKQNLEMVTLISPQEIVPEQPPAVAQPPQRPISDTEKDIGIPEREVAMADVNQPEVMPKEVSAEPNKNLPRPSGPYIITGHDRNPQPGGGGSGTSSGGGGPVVQPPQIIQVPDNPPPPEPQQPKTVSLGVITGKATSLPKPVYSEIAKRMRIEGVVRVQVLVDLDGRVISASVLNGSPYLRGEAQRAAMQARFSPTLLNNQPVKVSGVIIYNFQLSQ